MPRQRTDRKWRDQRDERIREAALDGHSAKWISQTFDVQLSTVYRVCEGIPFLPSEQAEPAEWELHLAQGIDLAVTPTDDWIDALEDVTPDYRGPVVYFVQVDGEPTVKIGVSTTETINGRMAGLQNASARKLRLRRMVKGDTNVEGVLHAAFSNCRIRGEWFDADHRLARVARLLP